MSFPMRTQSRQRYGKAVTALLIIILGAVPALAKPPVAAGAAQATIVRVSSDAAKYLDAETGVKLWLPAQLQHPPDKRRPLRHGGIDHGWKIPGKLSINVLAYDGTRSLSDLYDGLHKINGRRISAQLSHLAQKDFRLVGHDRGSPFIVVAQERDGRVRALSVVIPNAQYYKKNRQAARQRMARIIASFEPFPAEPINPVLPPATSQTPQPTPPPPRRTEPPPIASQPAWQVPRRSADGKFMELIGGTYNGRPMLEFRGRAEVDEGPMCSRLL